MGAPSIVRARNHAGARGAKLPPIFSNAPFTFAGKSMGPPTQYLDAFQRANFYKYTQQGGINPGYHVRLQWKLHGAINVPTDTSATRPTNCENLVLNEPFTTFDDYLNQDGSVLQKAESTSAANHVIIFIAYGFDWAGVGGWHSFAYRTQNGLHRFKLI